MSELNNRNGCRKQGWSVKERICICEYTSVSKRVKQCVYVFVFICISIAVAVAGFEYISMKNRLPTLDSYLLFERL